MSDRSNGHDDVLFRPSLPEVGDALLEVGDPLLEVGDPLLEGRDFAPEAFGAPPAVRGALSEFHDATPGSDATTEADDATTEADDATVDLWTSPDTSLPSVFTVDDVARGFELSNAPVSPAPAGASPAAADPAARTAPRTRLKGSTPSPTARPSRPPVEPVPYRGLAQPSVGRHARPGRIRTRWEGRYVGSLLSADLIAALGAGAVAFGARFGNAVTPYNRQYLLFTGLMPLILLASLTLNRAYERRFLFVGTDEYQRVLRAGLAMTAMTAIVSYAFDVRLARGYVVVALPLATVVSLGARFALRKHLHHRRGKGECLRRVIVVGHELAVVGLAHQLNRELYHGMEVVGCCLPPSHDGAVGMRIYGTFNDVAEAVEASRADTVIVLSCPELDGHLLRRLGWRLEREDIDLIVANSLIDVAGTRTTVRPVDGLPMLHVEHPRLSGVARAVKSVFDRLGAAAGLVLLAPVLLVIAAAIKRDSRGPVVFRQVRVGKGGREFMIFKFRTMHTDAECRRDALHHLNENDGVLFKMRDDPRITRIGRVLRRGSLDELPQLLNVLLGHMSLVGPRPPLPDEVAVYPADMRRRLAVRPGITGLWQVSGRSDLSWAEAIRLDLRYVENWSFSLDCVILLRTLSAVCRGSGAY